MLICGHFLALFPALFMLHRARYDAWEVSVFGLTALAYTAVWIAEQDDEVYRVCAVVSIIAVMASWATMLLPAVWPYLP